MQSKAQNIKLGGRSVRGSFIVIVILTILLAGSGVYGILTVERNNQILVDQVLKTEDLNQQLKVSVLQAREQDAYFRSENQLGSLKGVGLKTAEGMTYADQIISVNLTKSIVNQVEVIKQAISHYNQSFYTAANYILQRGGGIFGTDNSLVGDMISNDHQIEDLTLKLYNQNAINNFTRLEFLNYYLSLKREASDYLQHQSEPNVNLTEYTANFDMDYAQLKAVFQTSNMINETIRAEFLANLDTYHKAFFKVVDMDSIINNQIEDFNLKSKRVTSNIDKLSMLANDAKELGLKENSAQIRVLTTITLIVSVLSVGLTIYLARSTTSNILKPVAEMQREVEAIANGDLTHQTKLGLSGTTEIRALGGHLDTMIRDLAELVGGLVSASEFLTTSAEQLSSASEETNAAAEEVSSTSQSMSQAASQQAEMISRSVEEMAHIGDVVGSIIDTIQNNSDVISQIALQTNILALNAGIEASRAGDYGRGFAVVAENVRRLSEESKNAAEEINSVAGSISQTLVEAFESIKIQIEEVAALSEETAASAEEVAAAAEEVTSSMEQVASASQELSQSAQNSMDKTSRFKL